VVRRFQQEIFQNEAALATLQRCVARQANEFPVGRDAFGLGSDQTVDRSAIRTIESHDARRFGCWHGSTPTCVSSTAKRMRTAAFIHFVAIVGTQSSQVIRERAALRVSMNSLEMRPPTKRPHFHFRTTRQVDE
jgi:hypothetical protein